MQTLVARLFFFFNDTATTEIYTLSLHDALPIYPGDRLRADRRRRHPRPAEVRRGRRRPHRDRGTPRPGPRHRPAGGRAARRSEEHTSELQSRQYLVCRLLLEKKKTKSNRVLNSS